MTASTKFTCLSFFIVSCLAGTRGHFWNKDHDTGSALPSLDEFAGLKGVLEPTDTFIEGVNEECRKHLMAFQERVNNLYLTPGVSDYWALQMTDFSGSLPDGYLSSNIFSVGSYYSCMDLSVDSPLVLQTGETLTSFRGRYMNSIIYSIPLEEDDTVDNDTTPNLPWRSLGDLNFMDQRNAIISLPPFPNDLRSSLVFLARLGLCVPSSCSAEEIDVMINRRFQNFNASGMIMGATHMFETDSKADSEELNTLDIAFITILCFFGVCAIIGTILEIFMKKLGAKKLSSDSKWAEFFLGFSVKANTLRLFDASKPDSPNIILCLNGIRFMSMGWVLLSHTYGLYQGALPVTNGGDSYSFIDNFWTQVLLNGFPSVDSFYFLSGTLVAFLTFKELEKTNGHVNWFLFYIHRYLRLTAIYGMILLFRSSIMHLAAGGANHVVHESVETCRDVIWRHFLYINNFNTLDFKYGMCGGPSWYLATDMQMFLVTPLIMYPMWHFKKGFFDFIWPAMWCLASVLLTIILTVVKDWTGTAAIDVDPESDYWLWNYYMPWIRFQPYGVGIILGYILHLQKGQNIKVSWLFIGIGWILAIATGMAVIYGLDLPHVIKTGELPSKIENIFYGGFHRLAWGCALAWMVWTCVRGYGGIVNSFLSWEAFVPLSRLCYVMYLIHDLIMMVYGAWFTYEVAFAHFIAVIAICWVLLVTILVAIPIVIFLELPLLHMEKFFIGFLLQRDVRSKKNTKKT